VAKENCYLMNSRSTLTSVERFREDFNFFLMAAGDKELVYVKIVRFVGIKSTSLGGGGSIIGFLFGKTTRVAKEKV
jgi:hypothetical protein